MEDGHTSNKAFERETTLATLLKASKSFRTYAVRYGTGTGTRHFKKFKKLYGQSSITVRIPMDTGIRTDETACFYLTTAN